jgi:AcrR family transcriptional regulator
VKTKTSRAQPLTPEDRRASILDAAVPLLMEFGSDVTTRQLADAAGVAEGTLFRVFDDKQAIIDAAVSRFLDPTPTIEALSAIDTDQSLEAKLEQIVDIVRTRFAGVTGILTALGLREPPAALKGHANPGDKGRSAAAAVLEPHRHQLRIEPEAVVHMLRLLCLAAALPPMGAIRPTENREIVDVVLHGVLKPNGK